MVYITISFGLQQGNDVVPYMMDVSIYMAAGRHPGRFLLDAVLQLNQ